MKWKLKLATVLFLTLAIFVSGAFAATMGDLLISADFGSIITSADGKKIDDYTPAVHMQKGDVNVKLKQGASFDAGATVKKFSLMLKIGDRKLDPGSGGNVEIAIGGGYSPLLSSTWTYITSSDGNLFDLKYDGHGYGMPADMFKWFAVSPKGNQPFWITVTPDIQVVTVISFDGVSRDIASVMNTSKDMAITFKFTVEVPPVPPQPIKSEDRKELTKSTDVKLDDTGKVDLDSVKSTGTPFDKSKAVAIPMFTASVDVGGVVSGISADLSGKIPGATPASFGAGGGAVLYKVLASGQLKALTKVDSPSKEGEYSVSGTANDMKFNVWIDDRTGTAMTSDMTSFDFNGTTGVVADPLVVSGATTTANNPSKDGSSSGCNVVSTPLWWLTALPLVFMRRRK